VYGNHIEPPRSGYAMQFDGNKLYAFGGNGSEWVGIQIPYRKYKRTHFLVSTENGVMTVFADGNLVYSRNVGDLRPCNNNPNLILGRSHFYSDRFLYGELSNVKIFDTPKDETSAKILYEEGPHPWNTDNGIEFDGDYTQRVSGAGSRVRVVGIYISGSSKNLLDGKPNLYTSSYHRYFYHSGLRMNVGYNYMGGHMWFKNNGIDIFGIVGGAIVFENGIVGRIIAPSNGCCGSESAYIYYVAYADMPKVGAIDE
jgi:hypothetical protein